MFCYKQLVVFLLFLPLPTSTPLFMILFTAALGYHFRPCIYCVVLVSLGLDLQRSTPG